MKNSNRKAALAVLLGLFTIAISPVVTDPWGDDGPGGNVITDPWGDDGPGGNVVTDPWGDDGPGGNVI